MKHTRRTLVMALGRIQDLAGMLQGASSDRNPNRAAQLDSISREIFDVALAARCDEPLPTPRDHRKAI